MMAGIMSYFGGRRDPKQSSRDAIVTLRQQLQMIEKKEDYLQKKIEEETKKAKQNAVSNKAGGCRLCVLCLCPVLGYLRVLATLAALALPGPLFAK